MVFLYALYFLHLGFYSVLGDVRNLARQILGIFGPASGARGMAR